MLNLLPFCGNGKEAVYRDRPEEAMWVGNGTPALLSPALQNAPQVNFLLYEVPKKEKKECCTLLVIRSMKTGQKNQKQ